MASVGDITVKVNVVFVAVQCLGIWGRLFGHKFTQFGYNPIPTHCLRCGLPRPSGDGA